MSECSAARAQGPNARGPRKQPRGVLQKADYVQDMCGVMCVRRGRDSGSPPPFLTVLRRFETQLFLSSVPRLLEHQAELSTALTENDHHYRNLNKNPNNI